MSARPIAAATISFGLVSIPAKLYASGESAAEIRFNLLHRTCGSRLKQQYVCAQDGEIVKREDMAKGYEFARGQYVLFSDEELKALQAQATQTIEITEFLPTDKVDPIYFEKSYYLGPDKGGDRAYKLLARTLRDCGRSALAKYSARGRQYLVLLRPYRDGLVLQELRYKDELRSIDEVPLGNAEVNAAELKLARQIVEQGISDAFRPEEYEDEVRKRTMHLIERKVEGQEITEQPAEEPRAQVIDLMAALKASLEQGAARKPAKAAARRASGARAAAGAKKKSGRDAKS